MDVLGIEKSREIDWSMPCVMCIVNDFTRYDDHAVNQMQRNNKLIKYMKFEDNLIMFEHINSWCLTDQVQNRSLVIIL